MILHFFIILLALAVLPFSSAYADAEKKKWLRPVIGIPKHIWAPDHCVFDAAEPGPTIPFSHICAYDVMRLNAYLQSSSLKETCFTLQNFSDIWTGRDQSPYISFRTLKPGEFLLEIICGMGAYNASYLTFVYKPKLLADIRDETADIRNEMGSVYQPPPPNDKKSPILDYNIFSLLIFPFIASDDKRVVFDYRPYTRDYDSWNKVLYHYRKYLGDGSGGDYAEYDLSGPDYLPVLRKTIRKRFADYDDTYQFERHKIPTGKDWKRLPIPANAIGFSIPIDRPNMDIEQAIADLVAKRAETTP